MAVYAGEVIDAPSWRELQARLPRYINKSGATTYTSQATLQNDPDLVCSMEANSVYDVRIHGSIGGTDGDIQTSWSAPSNATGSKQCFGPEAGSTDRTNTNMRAGNHAFNTAVTYGVNSASSLAAIIEVGRVVTVDAGTFVFQAAQASSTANPSNIGQNTYMIITKVA